MRISKASRAYVREVKARVKEVCYQYADWLDQVQLPRSDNA